MVRIIPDQDPSGDTTDHIDHTDHGEGPPKPIFEARDFDGLWGLAVTKYPADEVSHFFLLIVYMVAFYGAVNLGTHLTFILCNKRYQKLDNTKQGEYRSNVMSPIHAISSVIFATLSMFSVCEEGNVFTNETCFSTARYLHIWALVNTCGYFVQDTFQIVFLIRTFTTFDKQMIGHHVIAFSTFLGTLAFMDFPVVFGVVFLFCEVSTPFICVRWFLYTHKVHRSVCMTINTLVIFVTFLFGRLVFQIGILVGYGYPWIIHALQEEAMPWHKDALLIFIALSLTISALMNLFWMYLVTEQVKRIFNRPTGEMDDDVSISSASRSHAEGPNAGGESMPLLPTMKGSEEQVDTDEERDVLHISST